MRIYRPLIILFINMISLIVNATEQSADILIYKSDTIYIQTYPFEKLMESDSLIRERIFGYSDKTCISSGCWRGHVATWTIENDSLFLIGLISGCEDYKFKLDEVFHENRFVKNKVFANWFTGDLLEYQSWFVIDDNNNSNEKSERFSCDINLGLASNIIFNSDKNLVNNKIELNCDTTIYLLVDTTPVLITSKQTYKITELKHFIMDNIRYPQNGADCMGSVYITFVVEKNGTISNKEFLRKLCDGYDDEAMKVVDLMVNWQPGVLNGVPVRTRLTLPLKYRYE